MKTRHFNLLFFLYKIWRSHCFIRIQIGRKGSLSCCDAVQKHSKKEFPYALLLIDRKSVPDAALVRSLQFEACYSCLTAASTGPPHQVPEGMLAFAIPACSTAPVRYFYASPVMQPHAYRRIRTAKAKSRHQACNRSGSHSSSSGSISISWRASRRARPGCKNNRHHGKLPCAPQNFGATGNDPLQLPFITAATSSPYSRNHAGLVGPAQRPGLMHKFLRKEL